MAGPDKEPRQGPVDQPPATPGHFVSAEHRSDLQRFLNEVKSLVEHRRGARTRPRSTGRGT